MVDKPTKVCVEKRSHHLTWIISRMKLFPLMLLMSMTFRCGCPWCGGGGCWFFFVFGGCVGGGGVVGLLHFPRRVWQSLSFDSQKTYRGILHFKCDYDSQKAPKIPNFRRVPMGGGYHSWQRVDWFNFNQKNPQGWCYRGVLGQMKTLPEFIISTKLLDTGVYKGKLPGWG